MILLIDEIPGGSFGDVDLLAWGTGRVALLGKMFMNFWRQYSIICSAFAGFVRSLLLMTF